MRGHGKDLPDGDDAGAAAAGHQTAVRLRSPRQYGVRQSCRWRFVCRRFACRFRLLRLFQSSSFDCDETRTKTADAGKILVAGRLIDLPLAAEFGFQRFDRQAIRLHAAIAAAFAAASLITTRLAGSGYSWRFLRRRFSEAQVWS